MAITVNVSTPPDHASAVFTLKQVAVTSAAWTVSCSGDGVSAYNAIGDISPSNADGLAFTGGWFVLKSATSNRSLLFVRNATAGHWTVKYSTSGFAGKHSATVPASSEEAQTLIDGALFGTDGTYRWLVSADSVAPYGLWAAALTTGTLAAAGAVCLFGLAPGSYDSTDLDPYILYVSSTSVLAWSELYQTYSGNVNFRGWRCYVSGLSGSSWLPMGFAVPWFGTANIGGAESAVNRGALSSVTGSEVPLDIVCGFRDGAIGIKGRVASARYVASSTATAPNGTHLTDGDGLYWVRVGDLWLQWDASVPTL